MGTEVRLGYRKDDIDRIKRLRAYYRKNFVNGGSDESFLTWIEGALEEMRGPCWDGDKCEQFLEETATGIFGAFKEEDDGNVSTDPC